MATYLVLPSSEHAATHRDASGAFLRVSEIAAGASIQGPTTNLRESLEGLTPILRPISSRRPLEISKLTLRRRLRSLGAEAAFDAALDAIPNARADWDDAQSLRTDDPLFTTAAPHFKAVLGFTDAQLAALLAP